MTSINWPGLPTGRLRLKCPTCDDRKKNLSVTINADDTGVAYCHKCHFTESYRPTYGAVRRAPAGLVVQPPQQHQRLAPWGVDLWRSTLPLSGVAIEYLRARKCAIPPSYGDLRWHPAIKHRGGYVGPALVALITDVHTCEPLSLHRTWITPTGKADVEPARMLLANHPIRNGVIRLWPDDDVSTLLGIAEGIETALSLAHAPLCVWATIDAGHLANFPLLAGIGTLVIAKDQDPAGIAAAASCAARWAAAGCDVRVTRQTANDLNDMLTEPAT